MKKDTQQEALRLAELINTECATWKDLYAAARELKRLHSENDSLRKDAERYRWLRDQGALADGSRHPHMWRCIVLLSDLGVEHADEAIDAAMKDAK